MHKSGFVNIVGNPNVGKSTLMNALVGERISIITSKAQTTRHRIMGIVNGEDFQIVYSDTPGVLKPNYKLQESMLKFSTGALRDADILLYVTDTIEQLDKNADFIEKVKAAGIETILVINKIDLTTEEKLTELVERWEKLLPYATLVPVSAKNNFNLQNLFSLILEKLPEAEPYYEKDALTDRPMRFFASEIIREKIFLNYEKEVPYSVEVAIEEYKETPSIDRIRSVIYVARDSQKGIIIGHNGSKLKKVGTEARIELENFLQKKVFLELHVKVGLDWRNDERMLRNFGYIEK
ncbi:MAG TPA: GTPase Era [Candidatus Avirikenella pullistercoris]|nr:GTPase Era [Candidatus Avirikenella pullistercoris]